VEFHEDNEFVSAPVAQQLAREPMKKMRHAAKLPCLSLGLLIGLCSAQAQNVDPAPVQSADLISMNIEDLMNIKVTSVSRTEEKLSRTASAVFVIGSEDIRDSGALNIPDLLRMVPGVQVAQLSSNTWAIAVRGFNERFSNKLLVMLDGRAVYSATIGGVFWDVLNVPLEDIERIEVIRGPGGSVWGANAVDGVINIITSNADATHGGLISAGGGNLSQGFGTLQYGGNLDGKTDYRIYTKYENDGQTPNGSGQPGGDAWHMLSGGFRTDTSLSKNDELLFQGNIYTGKEGLPVTQLVSVSSPPQFTDELVPLSGGFLQSVWNHTISERSGTTLEVSYGAYQRNDALRDGRKTFAADFQHHFLWGGRQDILWGLGLQYTYSHSEGDFLVSLSPASAGDYLFSSFVQDEIVLIPDRLYLTVGAKFEHNYYTGWAPIPSARVAWQISNRHMVWAAYSRPIRTPAETDVAIISSVAEFPGHGGLPTLVSVVGNPNYGNETTSVYELGYRASLAKNVSLDLSTYYNNYKNLQTNEPGEPYLISAPPPLHLVLPMTFANLLYGEAHGLEISTNWKVTGRWTISPGYAFEEIHMHTEPSSQDTSSVLNAEGSSPRNSAQLRSRIDLTHGLEWNASAYFVDRLTAEGIPAYTRVDTQLTWKWSERGSISFVGQNLQQDHHFEFQDFLHSIDANQAKRSVYAVLRWSY
jgi:iron complex outermembrane receptor protein